MKFILSFGFLKHFLDVFFLLQEILQLFLNSFTYCFNTFFLEFWNLLKQIIYFIDPCDKDAAGDPIPSAKCQWEDPTNGPVTYQAEYAAFPGRNFAQVVPDLVMFLVLLVKPYGLFGTEEVERV